MKEFVAKLVFLLVAAPIALSPLLLAFGLCVLVVWTFFNGVAA